MMWVQEEASLCARSFAVVDGRLRTRRRAGGVGELSREAKIAAKRPYGLRLRKLMLKPDLQNTEHGLDPDVLRNAGSKVVAVCCAATSSVIVPLAALQIFSRAERPRSRCDSKSPTPAEHAASAKVAAP